MNENIISMRIKGMPFEPRQAVGILRMVHDICPDPDISAYWDLHPAYSFEELLDVCPDEKTLAAAFSIIGPEKVSEHVECCLIGSETLYDVTADGSRLADSFECFSIEDIGFLAAGPDDDGMGPKQQESPLYFVRHVNGRDGTKKSHWFDPVDVCCVNQPGSSAGKWESMDRHILERMISPVAAWAWTFRTTVAAKNVVRIVRQGEAILVETDQEAEHEPVPSRPLTELEYRSLVMAHE